MKRYKSWLIYTTLLGFLAPATSWGGSISDELREILGSSEPGDEVAVIVTLSDQVDLKQFKDDNKKLRRTKIVKGLRDKAEKSQRPLKTFLQQNKGKKIKPFWIFNGMAVTLPVELVELLAAMEGVDTVSLDATLSVAPPVTSAVALPEWNIDAINATPLWDLGYTGTGAVLAIMDTGVSGDHPDLVSTWRGGSNSWYDPHGEHLTPYDGHGHGTQAAGIMVGGDAGGSSIGVAPGAQWIAVKMYDDNDSTTNSAIHAGFQWLLDPDGNPETDDAPDVVNNSWGFRELVNQCYTEFQADVQALKAAQIGVVFSAGNGGPYDYTSESPGNYPESLAVGSVDQSLVVSSFSSRGPSACVGATYPEVVAPGVNVFTTDLGSSYAPVAGTSFAAPHVAGAMGLLIGADPSRTIADVETALTSSALDLGLIGPDNDSGSGLLDVAGAWDWMSQNQPQCTDNDGDGFCIDPLDQTPPDCDDSLASVYPGAPEVKHDGVDQDCNGSDLSIDIILASYVVSDQKLNVEATSDLGKNAGLELEGYGTMRWNKKRAKWSITVGSVAQDPGSVTVVGPEGQESVATVVDDSGSSGGGDTGGGNGGGNGGGKGKNK